MCIMVFLTVLQFLRLITYFRRVIKNEYSLDMWVWYRATTDLCNYLLSVVALVLLVQWHQTYSALSVLCDAPKISRELSLEAMEKLD